MTRQLVALAALLAAGCATVPERCRAEDAACTQACVESQRQAGYFPNCSQCGIDRNRCIAEEELREKQLRERR